jgi:hypothetical protein
MALVALSVGYCVYAVARPHTQSFLLWHATPGLVPDVQTAYWLGAMPSLLHTFAFAILLALAVGPDRRHRLAALLAWCAIELGAEFAQLPGYAHWLAAHLGAASRPSMVRAFLGGTFSVTDIVAVLTGTALAAISLGINKNQKVHSHEFRDTRFFADSSGRRRARDGFV